MQRCPGEFIFFGGVGGGWGRVSKLINFISHEMISGGIEVNQFAEIWSVLQAKFEDDPLTFQKQLCLTSAKYFKNALAGVCFSHLD